MYAFKSKVRCRGGSVFEPGASGLPYYCTSTCVAVIGTLAVWRQNKNIKTKIEIQKEILDGHHSFLFIRLIWKEKLTLTIEDFVLYSDDHFDSHLPGNGLYVFIYKKMKSMTIISKEIKKQHMYIYMYYIYIYMYVYTYIYIGYVHICINIYVYPYMYTYNYHKTINMNKTIIYLLNMNNKMQTMQMTYINIWYNNISNTSNKSWNI